MRKILISFVSIMILTLSLNAGKSYPKLDTLEGISFLTNEDLKEIFKDGSSIVGTNLKFNKDVVQNYYGDGTYDGTVASGKKKISGKWNIKNSQICHLGKKKKKEKCRKVYKKDGFLVELNGKKVIMNFKVKR